MKRIVACSAILLLSACSQGHDLGAGEASNADERDDADEGAEAAGAAGGAAESAGEPGDSGNAIGSEDEAAAAFESEASGEPEAQYTDSGRTLTYYADAKAIIDSKCATCHFDGGIGPMPLTSYDEVEGFAGLIRYAVAENVMPPWTARGPLNHFKGDRRLSPEQKGMLLEWIDDGALEGDSEDEPPALPRAPRELARVDFEVALPAAYTPIQGPDDYRCFPLEWPYEETKFITGLSIEPDNLETVHHGIVYLVQPEQAESVRAQDAADPLPGYECFGTSGGVSAWLTSYEPGGYGQEIPGDLGFEVRPGSVMLLQIHYNTLNGSGPDQSSVQFELEDHVERTGDVQLIMNPAWVAGFMSIPAGEQDVVHAYTASPIAAGSEYEIHWADLHMHALGKAGRIGIVRADNPSELEPLLEIPDWAFEWQETYIMQEPVRLHGGDRLYVECHFDNTAEAQIVVNGERLQPRDVNWGDGTTDEMCLGNVLLADVE